MNSRALSRRAVAPLLAASFVVAAFTTGNGAQAQAPPPTTNPLEGLLRGILVPTTVPRPPAAPAPPPPPPAGAPAAPAPGAPPTTAAPGPGSIPPNAQAMMNSIRRTGGSSNRELVNELRKLTDLGLSESEAAAIGMGQFPLAGEAAWSDDFYFPRFNPSFHLHQGNDIFAARGVPVRAPADGTVRFTEGGSAGKAAYVTTSDGTYYFMCHLDTFARIPGGSRVRQGDILGTNGNTGNASGGAYHLHFEIHPKGGAAINPKPILDRWVAEAIANMPNVLAQYQVGLPRPLTAAGVLRRFDEQFSPISDADLYLSQASNPSGILRLSELRVARAQAARGQRSQAALEEAWRVATETSQAVLAPVTPALLQNILVPAPS